MGVNYHSKGTKESVEKENKAIPQRVLNFEDTKER
jgi:hypothetical protein